MKPQPALFLTKYSLSPSKMEKIKQNRYKPGHGDSLRYPGGRHAHGDARGALESVRALESCPEIVTVCHLEAISLASLALDFLGCETRILIVPFSK